MNTFPETCIIDFELIEQIWNFILKPWKDLQDSSRFFKIFTDL